MNCCRHALVVLGSVFVSAVLFAADTGTLAIQVVDSEGAVMGRAHISIRPDASGRQQPNLATASATDADERGRLTSEVEAGFFDICVMADAFMPSCQKVRVVAGGTKSVTVRMRVDPDVIREIGDTFPTRR
jgi:hypothetical protein